MKPTHEYYNIPDLIDRWSERSENISEIDLLKWGASGKLQFSAWITTGKNYEQVEIIQEYADPTEKEYADPTEKPSFKEIIQCKKIVICNGQKLCRLSKNSVEFLLDERKENTVFPKLLPDCSGCEDAPCNDKCWVRLDTTFSYWWLQEHHDYNPDICDNWRHIDNPAFSYLYITKADLVVSHEDMKQFEEDSFEPEVLTPQYLDPKHFAFNVELALAIETWEALFIDKSHLDEKTTKSAAQKYLTQYENYIGDEKKYRHFYGANPTKDSSPLGRISVMLNTGLLNKNTWKEFKQKNNEETTKD